MTDKTVTYIVKLEGRKGVAMSKAYQSWNEADMMSNRMNNRQDGFSYGTVSCTPEEYELFSALNPAFEAH